MTTHDAPYTPSSFQALLFLAGLYILALYIERAHATRRFVHRLVSLPTPRQAGAGDAVVPTPVRGASDTARPRRE